MLDDHTNYEAWQHRDLVQKVHDLEQKLQQQTQLLQASTAAYRPSAYTKPKKTPKPFDPSRYSTRKIALKFAYLGGKYSGFEHSKNNDTRIPAIEEVLWRALKKTRLIFPEHKPGESEDEVTWAGCDYSKCGRTDRGVSAFGQVIALRVRSARPVPKQEPEHKAETLEVTEGLSDTKAVPEETDRLSDAKAVDIAPPEFDPVKDELPYLQILNKVLPPDIRMLAWCADVPEDFSARFNCKERRYRYFFTNPAYLPQPGSGSKSDGWLNIDAMQEAASKYKGLHDFRNLCKIDPSKQIASFVRRIFHAGIHAVEGGSTDPSSPKLYYFEVRGSAFLWHQVRCLVAILFLVGQGYEKADLVDKLVDASVLPGRPNYEMATDAPLVLWDCIFPELATGKADHSHSDSHPDGHHDALRWIYVGDAEGQDQKRSINGDGRYVFGASGVLEDLWSIWRQRKIDELLAEQLMKVVARHGSSSVSEHAPATREGARIFNGSETPRNVGSYIPVMQRPRQGCPDEINARYLSRKGLDKDSKKDRW